MEPRTPSSGEGVKEPSPYSPCHSLGGRRRPPLHDPARPGL